MLRIKDRLSRIRHQLILYLLNVDGLRLKVAMPKILSKR